MTLGELEKTFEQRGISGVSVNCWDNQTRMWTATTRGESCAGRSLSEAVLNLLEKFPVQPEVSQS